MIDELEAVLFSLVGVFDGEEAVDEFSHALQSAGNAQRAGTDDELIVAALFHDVARSSLVAPMYPGLAHEVAGASWLRPRFGERVAWLVGAHAVAKVFLIEAEPGYRETLSPESRKSAVAQSATSPLGFIGNAWWPDAIRLRRFDDAAKEPDSSLPEVAALLDLARSILLV